MNQTIKNTKHILLRLSCLFCLLTFSCLTIQAQGEKVIFSNEIAASGTEACVEISVEGFTNVEQLSLRVLTNPSGSIATFNEARNFNLTGLSAVNILDNTLFGLLLTWDADNPNTGETLPDGTVIVEFCYDILGNPGQSVNIELSGTNENFFGKTNGVDEVPVAMDGSISIPEMTLEVVEGDILPDNCFDVDNGSVDIIVNGGTSPFNFNWSNMSTNEDLTGVAAGDYTVTVSDSGNPINEVIMSFTVPDETTEPTADVGDNDFLDCANDMITLGGPETSMGPEFAYQWLALGVTFISGQNSPMAVVDQAAVYTFRVTNTDTGCTTESFITVTEDKMPPNIDLGMNRALSCDDAGTVLTPGNDQGLDNLTAEWTTEDGAIDGTVGDLDIRVVVPGTYQVVLTNLDNGCTNEDEVVISEPILPSISLDGEAGVLNCDMPTTDLNVLTDTDITVSWSTTTGAIDGAVDMNLITVSSAGIYIAEATNPDTECTATFEVEVIGNTDEPTVNAGEDVTITCADPITSITGMTDAFGSIWTDANENFVSSELTIDVNRAGTFILVATNDFGCVRSDEVLVVADTMSPIANAGQSFEVGCITDGINLDGAGSDMGPNFSYMWSTSNGTLVSDFNTLTPAISSAGRYDLIVTNDDTGCTSLSSVEVSLQSDLPIADGGADFSTCENSAMLTGNNTDMVTGVWSTTSNASIDNPSQSDISISNLAEGANNFIWTLSTSDCADYSRDTVAIIFESSPTAAIDDRSIPLEESTISFNVLDNDNTSNNDGVVVVFQTNDPNFMDLGDGNFSYTFSSDSTSTFTFTYTLCSEVCPDLCDEATVIVNRVEPALEPVDLDGLLPNVITPNGDGLNDALVFDALITDPQDYPNPEFVVFNRWGDVVYRQQPYDNNWQGTNQSGKELPEGTYYFINRLSLANNEVLSGDVTIIRD